MKADSIAATATRIQMYIQICSKCIENSYPCSLFCSVIAGNEIFQFCFNIQTFGNLELICSGGWSNFHFHEELYQHVYIHLSDRNSGKLFSLLFFLFLCFFSKIVLLSLSSSHTNSKSVPCGHGHFQKATLKFSLFVLPG